MASGSRRLSTLHFSVQVDLVRPSESVFVTGSVVALGQWNPVKALQLSPSPEAPGRWFGFVEVEASAVQFRYFTGYYLENGKDNSQKELIVSKWESFLLPRFVLPNAESVNGSSYTRVIDTFGSNEGKELVSDGWLIESGNQNEILLRIRGSPFKFYKKRHSLRAYRIKVTPFDLRRKEETPGAEEDDPDDAQEVAKIPSLPSFSSTQLAILSGDDPRFHEQLPSGEHFRLDEDYFVFRTRSVAVDCLCFRIELYVHREGETLSGNCFATSYALPSSLPGSFGICWLPLVSSNSRPVGQLTVDYLFIQPLSFCCPPLTMAVSYGRHWKKRKTLEVGHRGMGNSYTKVAAGRENTMYSLNQAARHGADYVEFDVQLTKDKVAVIFHDFYVLTTVAKRHTRNHKLSEKDTENDYQEMAVRDLKLSQLQLLRLEHYKANETGHSEKSLSVSTEEHEEAETSPFPTLAEALRRVDHTVGFNVEVKYPMMQKNGLHECAHYFEHNEYVDIILADVLNNAGDRRIVFSSFDPDVCTLLAAKQNLYPVLFLCLGVTSRFEPFVDMRSSTSNSAVSFAASINILGVNFHSEDILRDPSPVQRAKHFGLVSFVWGDDLDNKTNMDYFRKVLLVDGVIYDRIGEVEPRRNVFVVEHEMKASLYARSTPTSKASSTIALDKRSSPCLSDKTANTSSANTSSASRSSADSPAVQQLRMSQRDMIFPNAESSHKFDPP